MKKKKLLAEIELFDFVNLLWDAKWMISILIIISFSFSFFIYFFLEKQYKVSIPYFYNITPSKTERFCEKSKNFEYCNLENITRNFVENFELNWKVENLQNFYLISTSKNLLKESEYNDIMKKNNNDYTIEILNQEIEEINFLQSTFNNEVNISNTEIYTKNLLRSSRITNSINNGVKIMNFGDVKIIRFYNNKINYHIISIFLGGILGIIIAVTRKYFKKKFF
tara:strand:+ start:1498 stop:2169 length:672 start_codon:yes stop_codon:yes gene_type:complete